MITGGGWIMIEQQYAGYRPQAGDQVRIRGGVVIFRVRDTTDLALVTLENRSGQQFRAGRQALELVARDSLAG